MPEKTRLNVVEALSDEEQAFDQACAFENRVGGHGTYCHNEKIEARKCPYRWTGAAWHSECEGFAANPAYTGQWESVVKPASN
jgi:hypothetical protein